MMKKAIVLAAVLSLFAVGGWAQTATGTLSVSATLLNSCNVTSGSLNFGSSLTFFTTLAQTDATGTFQVTCTNLAAYTVDLDAGLNASVTQRRVKHGTADFLNYNLFQDAGHTTAWGTTTGGVVEAGTGNGATQSLQVFGRIPGGQTPSSTGAYSDTVGITVLFTP